MTSAWDRVQAVPGPLLLDGAPGSRLRFLITLVAHGHDVPLSPCPDYVLAFYGPTRWRQETYQLNCAAVATVRDGVPYLPAGVRVTFAMEATAPAYSSPKTIWQIPVTSEASGPIAAVTFTLGTNPSGP